MPSEIFLSEIAILLKINIFSRGVHLTLLFDIISWVFILIDVYFLLRYPFFIKTFLVQNLKKCLISMGIYFICC